MESSKYLKGFNRAATEGKELFQLVGDCLLVEIIPEPEVKRKSGIVLAADLGKGQVNGLFADAPTFVRVLMVGEGYYDDSADATMKEVPLDSKPGDIILVGRTSIKHFSVFGNLESHGETKIGLVRESDVQMRFRGEDAFNRFFDLINSTAQAEMGETDGQ